MEKEGAVMHPNPVCPRCGSNATRSWNKICEESGFSSLNRVENEHLLYCQNCGCSVNTYKKEETVVEEKEKATCPKCGANAVCYWEEIGAGNQFMDEYTLVCELCGHRENQREDGGVKGSNEKVTSCPFCKTECYDHLAKSDYLARESGFRKRCQNCGRGGAKDFLFCPWCGTSYEAHAYKVG